MSKTLTNKLKIFFFGAPFFSGEILNNLLKNDIPIDAVITHPDRPTGRKQIPTSTEIKKIALRQNIRIQEFTKLDNIATIFFQAEKPDLFITASYGAIIPQKILNIPQLGAINVHPSLLPKLRGATPIQTALLKDFKRTGTSIMLMDADMDSGDILAQSELAISSKEKYPELEQKLISLSNALLIPLVQKIIEKKQLPSGSYQDNNQATFTKLIQKQDGLVNWQKSAKLIYNQWRAFYSWPKIYTFYNKQKIILTEIELIPKNAIMKISIPTDYGIVFVDDTKKVFVTTTEGYIQIIKLQIAGKQEMSIKAFLNGYPSFINNKLKSEPSQNS